MTTEERLERVERELAETRRLLDAAMRAWQEAAGIVARGAGKLEVVR